MKSYYETCAIPKPPKKKKKAKNNPVQREKTRCDHCGEWHYCQTNEIFRGNNRQNSIKYGFQNNLCPKCHEKITRFYEDKEKDEDWAVIDLKWKEEHQRQFEEEMMDKGMEPKLARQLFMSIIGKNYL